MPRQPDDPPIYFALLILTGMVLAGVLLALIFAS